MYTLNNWKNSLNAQTLVSNHPILAFFAHVLEIDHFHDNPKIIAHTPPVNMPTKILKEKTSLFEASLEGQNVQ